MHIAQLQDVEAAQYHINIDLRLMNDHLTELYGGQEARREHHSLGHLL